LKAETQITQQIGPLHNSDEQLGDVNNADIGVQAMEMWNIEQDSSSSGSDYSEGSDDADEEVLAIEADPNLATVFELPEIKKSFVTPQILTSTNSNLQIWILAHTLGSARMKYASLDVNFQEYLENIRKCKELGEKRYAEKVVGFYNKHLE